MTTVELIGGVRWGVFLPPGYNVAVTADGWQTSNSRGWTSKVFKRGQTLELDRTALITAVHRAWDRFDFGPRDRPPPVSGEIKG